MIGRALIAGAKIAAFCTFLFGSLAMAWLVAQLEAGAIPVVEFDSPSLISSQAFLTLVAGTLSLFSFACAGGIAASLGRAPANLASGK